MRRHPSLAVRRQAQRGGIALLFALLMVPIMGFMGLALDLSRIYINKTELQGAADACALSAAWHLQTTPVTAAAFTGATNGGRWIAAINKSNLQATAIPTSSVTVEFGTSLSGGVWNTAASAVPGASLVRCKIRRANIESWFLQVVGGLDHFQISAEATAAIPAAGSTNCGASTGNCNQAPSLVF
ncbi:pilus assembly protein TadG-related protein [Azohydromonas lata]|uniref:Pilus assembly protein TadG-related protein n=1 Tax=Azohydromonas lata TaxID=45677 RepID=A0ABU5IIG6_9BURK|nr:pilus assembly protein TadG-related protein [Azohydromonas lata]MDZ5458854.1 pilus assembly protein TadG-related protein [Azohydromonas lata]